TSLFLKREGGCAAAVCGFRIPGRFVIKKVVQRTGSMLLPEGNVPITRPYFAFLEKGRGRGGREKLLFS
ncbi:MAG: hypothetical protein J6R85_02355, partial [Lentisphaeria bacterium]|nr:hypothetical protein [Lentisphaeria bacterium]